MSDQESNKIFTNAQTPAASSCSAIFCFLPNHSQSDNQPHQVQAHLCFLKRKALGRDFLLLSLRKDAAGESSFNVHIPQNSLFHVRLEHEPPAASTSHNKTFS